MSDALGQALQEILATEGLGWLLFAAVLSGFVRGFSGFGTAMVYMPFAGAVLSPVWALTTLYVFDLFGPLPNVPRAMKDGRPRDILWLLLGAVVLVPLGVYLLSFVEPSVFRWTVATITLGLIVVLVFGWRLKREMGNKTLFATGAMSGFLAGVAALPAPPVILLYMSSRDKVATIRANILLYILLVDLLVLLMLGLTGQLLLVPVMIGAILIVPFLIANVIGAFLFRPEYEKLYRYAAYGLIAVAAVTSLPIFD